MADLTNARAFWEIWRADRLALSASEIEATTGQAVARYDAGEFDRMIAEQRPDTVIVTTPDYLHDAYIVRALRTGCDAITEKPMTIDLARLKGIVDAQRETGRSVTVTFNYRYVPSHTQLKDILTSGGIGGTSANVNGLLASMLSTPLRGPGASISIRPRSASPSKPE